MTNPQKQENGLRNIFVNVIIPVLILNKLSSRIGAVPALLLALSLPLGAGIYDFTKKKKLNYFSILGLINVSITGTLALLHLDGMWFSVKEAVFPSLIGVFVFASSYTKKPFIESLLMNPQLMQIDKIHQELNLKNRWDHFAEILKKATQLLAGTFLVSAVVNFTLARQIFIPLDQTLDESTRATLLNEQIGRMTAWAAGVIIIPSILMLSAILFYMLKGIRTATGLSNEDILKS